MASEGAKRLDRRRNVSHGRRNVFRGCETSYKGTKRFKLGQVVTATGAKRLKIGAKRLGRGARKILYQCKYHVYNLIMLHCHRADQFDFLGSKTFLPETAIYFYLHIWVQELAWRLGLNLATCVVISTQSLSCLLSDYSHFC